MSARRTDPFPPSSVKAFMDWIGMTNLVANGPAVAASIVEAIDQIGLERGWPLE